MNWLVILGCIAIGQGLYLVFTSWALAFSFKTKIALTLLMGSHIVLLLTVIFYEMDWYVLFPHFLYVRVPIPLLIGPSLYMLYKGIFPDEKPTNNNFLIHYIPFLIYVLIMVPYFAQESTIKLSDPPINNFIWINYSIIEHFKIVHLSAYLIWVFILNRNQKKVYKYLNFLERYRKLFVRILLFYTFLVVLSFANAILITYGFNVLDKAEFAIAGITTLLAYTIAYVFIKYDSQWKKAYKKISGKKSELGEQVISKLNEIMEEQKLYRNCDLKISDVAVSLGIPRQNLSEILNNELQTNFSKFLNAYRLKDFKAKVGDPKENNKTLIGLAYDSGFNSKSSFQRIFKDATGMTPKAYKKSLINTSQ
jgi:AraC-like DNA-binding protein